MTSHLALFLLLSGSYSIYLEQQLDSVMTMGWDIDECQIGLGYCSVGLRKTMTDCDMFAALVDKDKVVTIQDYWSRDHGTPKTDAAEGGENDYTITSTGSHIDSNGDIDITFTRKLKTSDKWDQQIYPDIRSQICWGYIDLDPSSKRANRLWVEHSDYDSATFAWATSESNMYFEKSSDEKKKHGILMSVAWALSATIGIAAARYFKERWWWFYVHFICLMFSSLATIITSADLFKDGKFPYETISDDTFLHSRVGMCLASLVIGQVMFGFCTSYFKIFTKNTHATLMFNRAHRAVGYALFIAGLYNCWIGWDLYGSMGRALITIGFILNVLFFGVLEIVQVFWWNKITLPKKNLPEYTHLQVMDMINDGKQLMFADELVINVGHFIVSHPGGSYMVKESIGEDTGKYMVGCSSYGADLNPYAHSEKAFSMLKTLAIGRIKTPEGYFSSTDSKDHLFIKFSMIKQVKLNEHTSVIYFSHPNFKMSNICNSPEWLGKHFMISYRKKIGLKKRIGYVKRYYSSLFVDLFQWEKELNILSKREEISDDGLVKFIYKVYPGGKMTNHLSSLSENENVLLRGPLGPGLLMSSLNGNYLALGGGTGLVPFLDLVYMAWKAYGSKTDKFRLRLFAFFRTSKDGFAIEILHKMAESCPWLQFRLVSDEDPNKKNIREDIRAEAKEGFDLAWICGPSGFNRSYNNLLIDNGIVKSKIVLL